MNKTELIILNLTLCLLVVALTVIGVSYDTNAFSKSDILGLIGGLLGGVITLLGVYFTINSSFEALKVSIEKQDNMKFCETIGLKLNSFYKVKKIIYKTDDLLSKKKYKWNENFEKIDNEKAEDNLLTHLLPGLNPLLEISASVDWEFYFLIKAFVEDARKIIYEGLDETVNYEKLETVVNKLITRLEDHEKRLSDKFKEVSSKHF